MSCDPVLTMVERGVVNLSAYITMILGKVVPQLDRSSPANFSDTLYSQSFSCCSCAQSAVDAVQEKLASLEIHSYHILPPCENLSPSAFVARLSSLVIFGFKHGPVIPVLISEKNLEQQKPLIHDIYTLSVFNKIFQSE